MFAERLTLQLGIVSVASATPLVGPSVVPLTLSPLTHPVDEFVVVAIPAAQFVVVVPAAALMEATKEISHMPGVKSMDVMVFAVPVVREVADPEAKNPLICSPINPAAGAVLVLFPLYLPPVEEIITSGLASEAVPYILIG